jgi:DNA recombination-dependent growth factor C
LKTLVFDLTKKGEDPFTRFKFKLEHIMPAHDVQEKLNKRIKKIEAERAARLQSQSGPGLFSTMKENDLAARKENDIAARKK